MLHFVRSIRPSTSTFLKCSAVPVRNLSDSPEGINIKSGKKDGTEEIKITGLAKALGKFRELEKNVDTNVRSPPTEEQNFLTLLRHSEFVRMGDPKGKVVVGRIFQVVNTDLYIDFGGKFFCVCRKPKRSSELYVRNAEVKVRINELELCARFLGATEDLTLTEASGTILDLISTPVSKENVIASPK